MADPRQNYLQQLRAYAQPQPASTPMDIPASVRTYSVFDPSSNTWRRMTNDGRSPMPASPAQQQASIADALAQARQTQGTVYPAQGMGQGQPVEMHPGYLNPPMQTPAQMPSRGSRTPSPVSGGQKATPVQAQVPSEPLNLVRNPAFLATGRDFQSEYDPSLQNGKVNILAQQVNPNVPQTYQGFNYLIPKMPEYEVKTLPAVQEPTTPNARSPLVVNKTNWNKVKYAGFPHTLGLVNQPPMTKKERLARENGTYSSFLNLFGYYD